MSSLSDIPEDVLVPAGRHSLARLHDTCSNLNNRPTFWEAERRGLVETYDPRAYDEKRGRNRQPRRRGRRP